MNEIFKAACTVIIAFHTLSCTPFAEKAPTLLSNNLSALTDSTGSKISPFPRAERIVTLMPSLAELMVAIDGDDRRIIGVSEYTDYPATLSKKPSVGSYQNVNLEQVQALKPDLILASKDGNHSDQIERLRNWGYRVAVVGPITLSEIAESIRWVGKVVGSESKGEILYRQFKEAESQTLARSKLRKSKPRLLLQLGDEPLVVVGGKNYLNDVIRLIGAENVYEDLAVAYPRMSHEDVLKKDPDQILVLTLNGDLKEFAQMRDRWDRFASLKAVRTKRVKLLRADALLRPGVRLPEGWLTLERAVYPE